MYGQLEDAARLSLLIDDALAIADRMGLLDVGIYLDRARVSLAGPDAGEIDVASIVGHGPLP